MSYTSLWSIDENWDGKEHSIYKNSWLFPPVIWDTLMCKYIPRKERMLGRTIVDSYMRWIGFGLDKKQANKRHAILNEKINSSDIQYDRVLWELSNLSVFNAKDKEFIADCILSFVDNNFNYYGAEDCEHIKKRFYEVAKDIRELPEGCRFFVIHPTSCDDNVEYWFDDKQLSDWNEEVCEFTLIENNKVVGFSDNLEMCKE